MVNKNLIKLVSKFILVLVVISPIFYFLFQILNNNYVIFYFITFTIYLITLLKMNFFHHVLKY